MKVVILTSETISNVWLVNHILAKHDVVGMVVERRPLANSSREKYERRRRLIRRYGIVRTANKLIYNWLHSRVLKVSSSDNAKQYFFPGASEAKYSRSVETLTVENINDPACVDFVKRLAPMVVGVCGTSVIRTEILSLPPHGVINIHTGITPEYRSADPIFWAVYQNEPDKVGVTIHFVDRGIDTGPIIHQESVPIFRGDTLTTIYFRCVRRGAELYLRALSEIATGSVQTIDRSDVQSRAFYSIDLGIMQFLIFQWRFRRLSARLAYPKTKSDEPPMESKA